MTGIRPSDRRHRRQLMIDAIAELDMAEVHRLARDHAANVNDFQVAIAQTDRTDDEVMDAYTKWLEEAPYWESFSKAIQNKVRNYIAQQPLFSEVANR